MQTKSKLRAIVESVGYRTGTHDLRKDARLCQPVELNETPMRHEQHESYDASAGHPTDVTGIAPPGRYRDDTESARIKPAANRQAQSGRSVFK